MIYNLIFFHLLYDVLHYNTQKEVGMKPKKIRCIFLKKKMIIYIFD